MNDFKVTVEKRHNAFYEVCLYYVGNDRIINKLLDCLELDCLVNVYITFLDYRESRSIRASLYNDIDRDKTPVAVVTTQHNGILHSFYNNLYKVGIAGEYPFSKLKGAGHALLCLALQTALANGDTGVVPG
jgi:hypothetical protein